ncbi:MAG: DUF3516 domain-containing protein, partial [Deltaproteobacteria bacterium]|nr:DUF3516 domain-containing protein [Deltaproteobacteria bacterium]
REFDLAAEPRLLAARVRAELHALVAALAKGDYEAAAAAVRPDADDPWDAERFARVLEPYFEEYDRILFTPAARQAHNTHLKSTAPRKWDVFQVLLDPEGDGLWAIAGEIDLSDARDPEGSLIRVRGIGA